METSTAPVVAGPAGRYFSRRIGDLPAEAARRWGSREAVVHGDRRWTHVGFAVEVDRVAKGLIAIGVEPGEKVEIGRAHV